MSENEYTGQIRSAEFDEVIGENTDGTLITRELPGTRLTIDLDKHIPVGLFRVRVIFETGDTHA